MVHLLNTPCAYAACIIIALALQEQSPKEAPALAQALPSLPEKEPHFVNRSFALPHPDLTLALALKNRILVFVAVCMVCLSFISCVYQSV